MTWKTLAFFAPIGASLLLAGCGRTTPLVIGPDHPASPEAAMAPAPPPSQTLFFAAPATPPGSAGDVAGGAASESTDHSGHAAASGPAATEPGSQTTQPAAGGAYVCPMHPEMTSNDPNARCRKCRMRLVAKEGGQ